MRMLEQKKVLVTGGSRGIGAGLVRAALQEGAEVAFFYRKSAELAERLCEEMIDRHPDQRCLAMQCDVADQRGMQEAIKSVESEFAMILVITHLDDLKERFPVRIDVQKGPDGSVLHTEWVA